MKYVLNPSARDAVLRGGFSGHLSDDVGHKRQNQASKNK
jgi:hypothetical protein